jgi:hypothetical protein
MPPKKQSDKPSKKNVEKAKTKNIEVTSENSFQKKIVIKKIMFSNLKCPKYYVPFDRTKRLV